MNDPEKTAAAGMAGPGPPPPTPKPEPPPGMIDAEGIPCRFEKVGPVPGPCGNIWETLAYATVDRLPDAVKQALRAAGLGDDYLADPEQELCLGVARRDSYTPGATFQPPPYVNPEEVVRRACAQPPRRDQLKEEKRYQERLRRPAEEQQQAGNEKLAVREKVAEEQYQKNLLRDPRRRMLDHEQRLERLEQNVAALVPMVERLLALVTQSSGTGQDQDQGRGGDK
jgi:hypothetical protein